MKALLLFLFAVGCGSLPQDPFSHIEPRNGYRLTDLSYDLIPLSDETREAADSLGAMIHFTESDFDADSYAFLFFVPENEASGKFAFDGDIDLFLSDTTKAKLVIGQFYGFYLIVNDTLNLTIVRSVGTPAWFVEFLGYGRYEGGIVYGRRSIQGVDFTFDFEARYMTLDSLELTDEAREILEDINAECVVARDC